jgi:predicted regulator of Ras-like GTPase activity (Roadblock/LC7/MglB family)
MQFIREQLTGKLSREAEASLQEALQSQFWPVVSGTRREWSRVLGLDSAEEPIGGDLILTPEGELLYYRVSPGRDAVVAGGAWASESGASCWEAFRDLLSDTLGNRRWQRHPLVSPAFQALLEEAAPLQVGEKERKAARILASPQRRRLLQLIASSPGIVLQQAAEGRPLPEVGAEVEQFDNLGMLTREYEVYCRKTEQKISRVSSLAALDEASGRGFKCFHCGRSISQEQIRQLLMATPEGLRLSRPNVWLAMLLGGILVEKGVDPARVLWRQEPNHHIVEVFADVEGGLLMFQVLEDGVSADQAFRFLARTRFFRPDIGFLVTPTEVRKEARAVLRSNETRLEVFDNLEELGERIEKALQQASRTVVYRLLDEFAAETSVPLGRLIGDYFLGPAPVEEPPEDSSQETDPELEERVEESAPALEISPSDPIAPHQFSEFIPVEEPTPDFAPAPTPEDEPLIESSIPPMIEDFAQELLPGPVALPDQDREGVLETLVPGLLAHLASSGPGGDDEALEEYLRQVAELEECSAMLADSDGLAFLGELDTMEESDLVCALHVELLGSVRRILDEVGAADPEALFLEGAGGFFQLHPSVEGLSLLVNLGRGDTRFEDEVTASLPGEMALREAMLKKSLEDMSRLDGVRGSLVSQREGLPIEALLPEELQAERLAALLAHLVVECEAFADPIGMGPLRQVLLQTSEAWYSVLLLGAEGFLATVLEPGTSREIWRHRLQRESRTVASVLR